MLCKVLDDLNSTAGTSSTADKKLKNMHIVYFPEMSLFLTNIVIPDQHDLSSAKVVVTFAAPDVEKPKTLDVPLKPLTAGLETVDITMHKSSTKAYNMGDNYNEWFSSCFGFEVVFVYLGEHLREALCSTPFPPENSWTSSIVNSIPLFGTSNKSKGILTFADCVPYLVVSQTSLEDVSARLPDGEEMDITKFRPNIVIEGAEKEWEEDYWGELQIGSAKILCAHNCARCASINVDFTTGKFGTDEAGSVLKKLQKDRRIDQGVRYSPVFGRYSFLEPKDNGKVVRIGDEVTLTKRNSELTKFGT
jgi:uncharacterized protein YcbX